MVLQDAESRCLTVRPLRVQDGWAPRALTQTVCRIACTVMPCALSGPQFVALFSGMCEGGGTAIGHIRWVSELCNQRSTCERFGCPARFSTAHQSCCRRRTTGPVCRRVLHCRRPGLEFPQCFLLLSSMLGKQVAWTRC